MKLELKNDPGRFHQAMDVFLTNCQVEDCRRLSRGYHHIFVYSRQVHRHCFESLGVIKCHQALH